MKAKLHIPVCITALSVLPLLAGNGETTSVPVQQRLLETDLSLAIRQYERVQMEAFETRLKLDLLDADEGMTDTDRKKRAELLAKRHLVLEKRVSRLLSPVPSTADIAEPLGRGEPPPRGSAPWRQPIRIALLRPTVSPGGGLSPVAFGQ